MSAKKIIFILSLCICAIIGSTFLLKPAEKTKKFENEFNETPIILTFSAEEYETRIKMADFSWNSATAPITYYKTYDSLNCVEFIYPSDITDDDIAPQMIYDFTLNDGTEVNREKPSERIYFQKAYGETYLEGTIIIDISGYYKDESTAPLEHYFEDGTDKVLSALLEEGFSANAGEDFVSYTEFGELDNNMAKYYEYKYISPGNPEIRANIRYTGDFKEQFDLYIEEFEKTIKRKEIE